MLSATTMVFMTIGYEGIDFDTFVAELKANRVTTLIDVRELPLSRKKGFSKSALAAAVKRHGITYLHLPALGCPRDIRKDYYADKNWGRYQKRYNAYLETQCDALNELMSIGKRGASCLVCFEADYRFCHRSLITDSLARSKRASVNHLTPINRARAGGLRLAAA
jgi:uncharacterized protein (DUF488 family)